jgi:hypothetical protein
MVSQKQKFVLVCGPDHSKEAKTTSHYASLLETHGYTALCCRPGDNLIELLDSLVGSDEYPGGIYALGIQEGGDRVALFARNNNRVKAIALVSGCYHQQEDCNVKMPTIIIHGNETGRSSRAAREFYQTIPAAEKMIIRQEGATSLHYSEDIAVMDTAVQRIVRWFNMH